MSLINNQPLTSSFISHKTETGDFVFLKIERMDSGFIDKNKLNQITILIIFVILSLSQITIVFTFQN